MLGIPQHPPQPAQVSTIVEQAIEESVQRFEQKFSGFGMLQMARMSGWIEEYRQELRNLAKLAGGQA